MEELQDDVTYDVIKDIVPQPPDIETAENSCYNTMDKKMLSKEPKPYGGMVVIKKPSTKINCTVATLFAFLLLLALGAIGISVAFGIEVSSLKSKLHSQEMDMEMATTEVSTLQSTTTIQQQAISELNSTLTALLSQISAEPSTFTQPSTSATQAPSTSTGGSQTHSSTGGAQYIRWGRTTCPNSTGTELLYSGVAAGNFWNEQGGGTNHLCLTNSPVFLDVVLGLQPRRAELHGMEYETESGPRALEHLEDVNVPCVACYNSQRAGQIMIPGTTACPDASWTMEYAGYLMSQANMADHYRTSYECVDKDAQGIPGSASNTNGGLFFFVEAKCNGINCPPYRDGAELTCVVCTK